MGGKISLIVDSGVRSGTDAARAVAHHHLGAQKVHRRGAHDDVRRRAARVRPRLRGALLFIVPEFGLESRPDAVRYLFESIDRDKALRGRRVR